MTTETPHPTYKRVLLKLSGEAFGGGKVGLDPDVVREIADQIAEAAGAGVQVAVVMGGGNFFRGAELQRRGMDRARAVHSTACDSSPREGTGRDLRCRLRSAVLLH